MAEEIEAYLLTHPDAADTTEGIAKWWIALQRFEQMREEVEEALESLVTRGVIVKRRLSDGRVIYSKAPN